MVSTESRAIQLNHDACVLREMMKEKTKTRIWLACLLFGLTLLGLTIGSSLVGLGSHIWQNGMRSPEWWGWVGSIVVCALASMWTAGPALLISLVCFVLACRVPKHHAVTQLVLAAVLGITSIITWQVLKDPVMSMVAGGIISLLIVAVVIVTQRKMRRTKGCTVPPEGAPSGVQ